MDQEEYQKQYDAAAAELEAAGNTTTARDESGKFTKAPEETPELIYLLFNLITNYYLLIT